MEVATRTQPVRQPREEPKRCICNKLTCVIRDNVIEIKCNKCKRMTYIHTLGIQKIVTV